MQPASTSLRKPAGLMRRYMIIAMVKINPFITLLSELSNSRMLRILNKSCGLIRMLNVDKGVMLVDNRLKILQRQSILQIQSARFIPVFLSSNVRTTLLF